MTVVVIVEVNVAARDEQAAGSRIDTIARASSTLIFTFGMVQAPEENKDLMISIIITLQPLLSYIPALKSVR
jgi:hypothetical protein